MAHIKIKSDTRTFSLVVDGMELAHSVLQDGFKIVPADIHEGRPAEVHLVLAADVLEVELPEAVVVASRGEVA